MAEMYGESELADYVGKWVSFIKKLDYGYTSWSQGHNFKIEESGLSEISIKLYDLITISIRSYFNYLMIQFIWWVSRSLLSVISHLLILANTGYSYVFCRMYRASKKSNEEFVILYKRSTIVIIKLYIDIIKLFIDINH